MSGTQFKPAQHGGWFSPQDTPSIAVHPQAPRRSLCPRCAGSALMLTLIVCAFAGLPGGRWQMVTVSSAATWGMAAMAANTKNATHIVRVLGSGCRGSMLISGTFLG